MAGKIEGKTYAFVIIKVCNSQTLFKSVQVHKESERKHETKKKHKLTHNSV